MVHLSWNRDEHGIITIYATSPDGRIAEIADFWVRPMVDQFGMQRSVALDWQQQFAELLVRSHNRLSIKADGDGGFAMPAPPPSLDSTPPDGACVGWECPIGTPNCQENCGSYGCGN